MFPAEESWGGRIEKEKKKESLLCPQIPHCCGQGGGEKKRCPFLISPRDFETFPRGGEERGRGASFTSPFYLCQ